MAPKSGRAKGKAMEVHKSDAVAERMPSFMEQYAGAGTEKLTATDLEVPRIKLLQALSPELDEFNEAEKGVFWHAMADASLGDTVRIVPVWVDLSFILWRPREMGGGILARAADGVHWSPDHGIFDVVVNKRPVKWALAKTVAGSGLDNWGTMDPDDNNSPPAATRMYNVVCIMPDLPREYSPAVVTLQRSAISVARKFLGKLKISQVPSFGQYFEMSVVEDTNTVNQAFYNYKFTKAGLVEDEDEFNDYRKTYEAFKQMGLHIKDVEKLQDDDAGSGAEPKGENKKF